MRASSPPESHPGRHDRCRPTSARGYKPHPGGGARFPRIILIVRARPPGLSVTHTVIKQDQTSLGFIPEDIQACTPSENDPKTPDLDVRGSHSPNQCPCLGNKTSALVVQIIKGRISRVLFLVGLFLGYHSPRVDAKANRLKP